MLNRRAICLGVLCVFFVASVVFAQSQSATETIIEKIYQSEMQVREHETFPETRNYRVRRC